MEFGILHAYNVGCGMVAVKLPQPTDIICMQYTKCVALPENEQVMLQTYKGLDSQ
jgi:hypothetical protein